MQAALSYPWRYQRRVDFVSANALVMRRELFARLGGLGAQVCARASHWALKGRSRSCMPGIERSIMLLGLAACCAWLTRCLCHPLPEILLERPPLLCCAV